MEKLIDLHTHSTDSDGTLTPTELVELAKNRNISALALTDHDTISGLDEFFTACKNNNIEGISGVEISGLHNTFKKFEIHILALNFPFPNNYLHEELKDFKNRRTVRNIEMIEKFNKIGFNMTMEELQGNNPNTIVTRAHFASVLLEKGYVSTRTIAFDNYLSKDCPTYVSKTMPNSEKVIEIIHKSGGVAILAHPTLYKLELDEIKTLCKELKNLGLDGLEVIHSSYTKNQRKYLQNIANELGLFPSGGSDFHGKNKPLIQLGSGKGNLSIPYSILEHIKSLKD